MKKILLIVLFTFITACSKKEEKFELFSAEAFAYSMDSGWELNATIRVKGFLQNEKDDKYFVKLSYCTDLETPSGERINRIGRGVIDKTFKENQIDLPVEIQAQLNSSYKPGNYKIIFHVKDELTKKEESISSTFELSK